MNSKLLLCLGALISTASTLHGAIATFRVGVNGYTGGRETYVNSVQNGSGSLGALTFVSIDASDDGVENQGLLAFDNIIGNGIAQIPPEATINSATLDLTIDSAGSGVKFHRMLIDWDEATATWNSLGNGLQADGVEAVITPSVSLGANNGNANIPNGPLLVDVAADVQAWANGTANFGWALLPFVPNGTNGVDFFSKEDLAVTSRPKLTVDFTPIPEPAAIGVMALSGAVLLSRRRS
jgi:hypothetical protein